MYRKYSTSKTTLYRVQRYSNLASLGTYIDSSR